MTAEELKSAILEQFPGITIGEGGEFPELLVAPDQFKPLMSKLRFDKTYVFDFLSCLTCVDWKTHLTMVYHLVSRKHRMTIVVKCQLADVAQPETDTVSDIWKTANFHEREVYDLFGVRFNGHPDLRRILLDENWEGYPLRKNYKDENMIEL